MKKQKDLYDYKGEGICFPVSLYNIFPNLFTESEWKDIYNDFDIKNRTVGEILKYFNEKLNCNSLVFDNISPAKTPLKTFNSLLEKYNNNSMILIIGSTDCYKKLHAVSYLGVKDSKILFFENNDQDLLKICLNGLLFKISKGAITPFNDRLINLAKEIKNISYEALKKYFIESEDISIGNNFSTINKDIIYFGCNEIYLIHLDKDDNKIKNFTSRLDILNLPKLYFGISDDFPNITLTVEDIKFEQ